MAIVIITRRPGKTDCARENVSKIKSESLFFFLLDAFGHGKDVSLIVFTVVFSRSIRSLACVLCLTVES